MSPRKLSTILIITVVASFIGSLIMYNKNIDGLAKLIDLTIIVPLWAYVYSYLPLEKNRKPYIFISIGLSILAIVLYLIVMTGYDFHFGKNV